VARQMIDSLHRIEFVRRLGDRAQDPRRTDPASELFDPVRAAYLYNHAGNEDEAAWLVFLSTHFGFNRRIKWELTRRVYGALGEGPVWTWVRTSADLGGFERWFVTHARQLAGLPFGNHRKYESLRPGTDNSLVATIASYVDWVGSNRGFAKLVADIDKPPSDAKTRFDRLYRASPIVQFGRTGNFDFLTMIGKLGIADIEPPLPYLQGATGPIRGARLLITNDPIAKIPTRQLSDRTREPFRSELGGSYPCMGEIFTHLRGALADQLKSARA
jgi:Alpha-glutamyl/putrescinyl thymine pyrophosphorylase clade 3